MIRKPNPGDRVLAPGWPARKAATVVEVRPPTSAQPTRVIVHIDDAALGADGQPVPRIYSAAELEPEELSGRARARAAGKRR